MRGAKHLPNLESVIHGLSTAVYKGNHVLRLVRHVFWETGRAARLAHFRVLLADLTAALDALSHPAGNKQRRGTELSLWLRKFTEHLATLLCFADDDMNADYTLWLALCAHERGVRLLHNVQGHLSSTTNAEIDWTVDRKVSAKEILKMVNKRHNAAARPWFVDEQPWSAMLNGDQRVVSKWRVPTMHSIFERARARATPAEKAVLGVYQLNYGLYSTQIHAGAASSLEPWERMYNELLLVVAALLGARVSRLLKSHERDADDTLEEIISDVSGLFRLDSPPKPGDKVWLLDDRTLELEVAEVSPDGLLARVLYKEASRGTEVRPCATLIGR
jgi:hypothetical protein